MPGEYSQWKLTFDPSGSPKVLVDFNQKLAGDLKFPQRNGLDVVPSPDSGWPLLLATGNSSVIIAVEVFADESTDKAARAALLNSLIATAGYGVKPLKIEVAGYSDRYWTFASCGIAEYDAQRALSAPTARNLKGYKLTCAGLSYTGP